MEKMQIKKLIMIALGFEESVEREIQNINGEISFMRSASDNKDSFNSYLEQKKGSVFSKIAYANELLSELKEEIDLIAQKTSFNNVTEETKQSTEQDNEEKYSLSAFFSFENKNKNEEMVNLFRQKLSEFGFFDVNINITEQKEQDNEEVFLFEACAVYEFSYRKDKLTDYEKDMRKKLSENFKSFKDLKIF
ncbi:hypothetical protein CQA57_05820 [Helicobacter anseris]|uniref:Uncharacterized protein n=1 Tax=Helicobacter anseris TaxID=375926 RepID=A0A3D8J6D9_9HELI|nr:hypothetical protein [Helicobacter anseris]RDU73043.1 hypothetical protein CQA57_05820 [Helicobacter anseris]